MFSVITHSSIEKMKYGHGNTICIGIPHRYLNNICSINIYIVNIHDQHDKYKQKSSMQGVILFLFEVISHYIEYKRLKISACMPTINASLKSDCFKKVGIEWEIEKIMHIIHR